MVSKCSVDLQSFHIQLFWSLCTILCRSSFLEESTKIVVLSQLFGNLQFEFVEVPNTALTGLQYALTGPQFSDWFHRYSWYTIVRCIKHANTRSGTFERQLSRLEDPKNALSCVCSTSYVATIRMDIEAPAEAEKEFISIDSTRHWNRRQACCKPKNDVYYLDSGSSDSGSDRSFAYFCLDSSDSDKELRKYRGTNKATMTNGRVICSHDKGRNQLEVKDLKPRNPLCRQLLCCCYRWLENFSSTRSARVMGKVTDSIKHMNTISSIKSVLSRIYNSGAQIPC